jgi:primary-amine oxidase
MQPAAHPRDALTAAEYSTVFDVLKASGKANDKTRYARINLQEPPKTEVLAWKKGTPFRREVLVLINQCLDTYEAVVDVSGKKLSAWRKIEVDSPATGSDEERIRKIEEGCPRPGGRWGRLMNRSA